MAGADAGSPAPAPAPADAVPTSDLVQAELVAVVVAVGDGTPLVLTTAGGRRLPSGPLRTEHRSLQTGLRSWVERRTGYDLGYIEQLYTFADRARGISPVLSVSYLGLTTVAERPDAWRSWYEYFPWEDRRAATGVVETALVPALRRWADGATGELADRRRQRIAVTFGLEGQPWRPERALDRYELLWEAQLVPEARGGIAGAAPGTQMDRDHRRILATAVDRIRSKIQYRPVVFELMPETFTLGRLQQAVEAVAGEHLHKQNFRRLVEQQELVEETGEVDGSTGGRPARLYRYRQGAAELRGLAGTRLPVRRGS